MSDDSGNHDNMSDIHGNVSGSHNNVSSSHDNEKLGREDSESLDVLPKSKEQESRESILDKPGALIQEPIISRERIIFRELIDNAPVIDNGPTDEHSEKQPVPKSNSTVIPQGGQNKFVPKDSDTVVSEFAQTTSATIDTHILHSPSTKQLTRSTRSTTTLLHDENVNITVTPKPPPNTSHSKTLLATSTSAEVVFPDGEDTSSLSATRPASATSANHTAAGIDNIRHGVVTAPSPHASASKALVVVPVVLGIVAIVCVIAFVLIVKKRRANRRPRKQSTDKEGLQEDKLLSQDEPGPIYAKVDMSKKKRSRLVPSSPSEETEMIQLLPVLPGNGHCLVDIPQNNSSDVTDGVSPREGVKVSPGGCDSAVNLNESLVSGRGMVDNDVYESTEMLNRTCSSSGEEDAPSSLDEIRKSRTNEMRASKDLPPLPQCVGAHSDDTSCPACSDSSRPVHTESDPHYLAPKCHDHPPMGPDWKPFHPYDPVYVPTSSASDMNRRVDSAGYVSRQNVTPENELYEEINYSELTPPPIVARMTMGATASGGRKPPRMLPLTPRGSYGTDAGPYGLTAIAGLSVSATADNRSQPGPSIGARGDGPYQTVSSPNANASTYVASAVNGPIVTSGVRSQNQDRRFSEDDATSRDRNSRASVDDVTSRDRHSRASLDDATSRDRGSKTSSTVSSNKDEPYETVEFRNPDV